MYCSKKIVLKLKILELPGTTRGELREFDRIGLPDSMLKILQRVQNYAARLVVARLAKSGHIIHVLHDLH